jgi:hypothetical protein
LAERKSTHSSEINGKRYIWDTERLWKLAESLPPFDLEVESFEELDVDCWFGTSHPPTIREITAHCRRINSADWTHPVIVNSNGRLMDGGHRLARALLEGRRTILAVRFEEMPEPGHRPYLGAPRPSRETV